MGDVTKVSEVLLNFADECLTKREALKLNKWH